MDESPNQAMPEPTGAEPSAEAQAIRALIDLVDVSLAPALMLLPAKYKSEIKSAVERVKEIANGKFE